MIKRVLKAIKDLTKGKPLALRSSHWDEVRDSFLANNNSCAACGSKNNLQVHHIKPFHLFPEEELNLNNLITLCEGKNNKCHLNIGHHGNWKNNNPDVVNEAKKFLDLINNKNI